MPKSILLDNEVLTFNSEQECKDYLFQQMEETLDLIHSSLKMGLVLSPEVQATLSRHMREVENNLDHLIDIKPEAITKAFIKSIRI